MTKLQCVDKELSLLIVDDSCIKGLNNDYFDRNYPTNVISFAMTEGEYGNINPHVLGDIVVSIETAHRDAGTGGIDPMDEVEFLIIHGLLHLLGYDHENTSAENTKEMNDLQRDLFFSLRHYYLDRQ